MSKKTIILGVFAPAAILVATAASAAPTDAGTARSPVAGTTRADRPDQRYCIVSNVTGSRIPRQECHQLADWQDMGVDPRLMARRR